jgi:hypothetical protein
MSSGNNATHNQQLSRPISMTGSADRQEFSSDQINQEVINNKTYFNTNTHSHSRQQIHATSPYTAFGANKMMMYRSRDNYSKKEKSAEPTSAGSGVRGMQVAAIHGSGLNDSFNAFDPSQMKIEERSKQTTQVMNESENVSLSKLHGDLNGKLEDYQTNMMQSVVDKK